MSAAEIQERHDHVDLQTGMLLKPAGHHTKAQNVCVSDCSEPSQNLSCLICAACNLVGETGSLTVCPTLRSLSGQLYACRQVSIEEGDAKAREFSVMFIETSAKAGFNIKVIAACPDCH